MAYLIIIALCLTVFGIFYTFLSYRNKERLALLESGLDMDFFRLNQKRQNVFLLTFGMIFLGFSIGVLSGFFLEKYLLENFNPNHYRNYPQAYLISVAFFVGLFMLLSFIINKKNNR